MDFAAAVRWLLEPKELPSLRVGVLGEPATTVNGPVWCRSHEGPVPFQLATALPNEARGWWSSTETMAAVDRAGSRLAWWERCESFEVERATLATVR